MADRRMSFWDDTRVGESITSGGVNSLILSLTPGGQSEGFTLVRTIVQLGGFEAAAPSAQGAQRIDVGIGLATKEAVALGPTALPDPNVNTEQPIGDWIWRESWSVFRDNTNVVVPQIVGGDFRGGRKLAGGQLFMIITNANSYAAAFTVRILGMVRMLILRP